MVNASLGEVKLLILCLVGPEFHPKHIMFYSAFSNYNKRVKEFHLNFSKEPMGSRCWNLSEFHWEA